MSTPASVAARNKAVLQAAFAETATGNGRPLTDVLADDVQWTILGTTPWSRTYHGKRAVLAELLRPLAAQLGGRIVIRAARYIAEGDHVVVEGRGHNRTCAGQPYANAYCWIFRFRDGRVVEITEYADTALMQSALHGPAAS